MVKEQSRLYFCLYSNLPNKRTTFFGKISHRHGLIRNKRSWRWELLIIQIIFFKLWTCFKSLLLIIFCWIINICAKYLKIKLTCFLVVTLYSAWIKIYFPSPCILGTASLPRLLILQFFPIATFIRQLRVDVLDSL